MRDGSVDRLARNSGIRHIERDRKHAVAIFFDQFRQLFGAAGRRNDGITCLKRSRSQRPTKAA
ncbi:hypothetical protein Gain_0221_008 [Komagataeibacter intermedius TF2]|nr:hypothetical protein Gain_0221_008 [Komagataeibacter intermedius TF2]